MRIIPALMLCMGLYGAAAAQTDSMLVDPALTSPGIVGVWGNHTAYINKTKKPVNKLLVMIVGTGTAANHNIPFFNFAAGAGYHVVSVDYKNTVITTACSNSEDSTCFDKFRQEIVFGDPVSELVNVDAKNSIYNRLHALLVYLSENYPKQGWQQYLLGDSMNWPKIMVAGHSQGAGHAAYLAKKFPVYRALIFAGPQDYLVKFASPAGWLRQASATNPSKYFAFLHTKDPYDFNKQSADCLALMPPGTDVLLVRPNEEVARKARILVTNFETSNPHEAMMQPPFSKAWAYLLSDNVAK